MCICLPERLQTDIWVWEAMVLDLPINQVLKDAVLGSAGHLASAHKYKYKYSVLVCSSAKATNQNCAHKYKYSKFVFVSICVKDSVGAPNQDCAHTVSAQEAGQSILGQDAGRPRTQLLAAYLPSHLSFSLMVGSAYQSQYLSWN